jgi:hypothetical protein
MLNLIVSENNILSNNRADIARIPSKSEMRGSRFLSYQKARAWAKEHGIHTWKQWCEAKRPQNIPSCPWRTYTKTGEWKDWGTFIGTGIVARQKRVFVTYLEAVKWVRTRGIKTTTEWRVAEKPADIPNKPNEVYARSGDWKSWRVFLHGDMQNVI